MIKMINRRFILLICFVWGMTCMASGQSIDLLKEEIRQAEDAIKATNDLIAKTKDKQKDGVTQLKLVQSKINNRKKILSNLDKQIILIGQGISTNNKRVNLLNKDYDLLKAEYARMMKVGYKNYKWNNYLLFLFSSVDFNDLVRRMYYIRRYSRMRENKAEQIQTAWKSLREETESLEKQHAQLDAAIADKNKEIKSLAGEQMQYQTLVNALTNEEKQLNRTLAEKQNLINKLQSRIQQIIEEEARKMRGETVTDTEQQNRTMLTGKFDQNKGNLPYPIREGVIVDRFGLHPHPTIKGTMVNNKGVNIAAQNQSAVYAVFEGEVSKVFFFQGMNNSVIIRHGNYMTVYSNLSEVNVKNGDKVSLHQKIGKLSADDNAENAILHFEIWQETNNLNPEEWLKRL